MHFDDDENFLGGELIEDSAVIVEHNYWRDAAWHRAVRRDDFATEVLNEHTNDHGLYAVCGCAFPCERAVLAEHNLAL